MTSTHTSSVSEARIEFLCVQVEYIILRLVPDAARAIKKVGRPALETNILRSLQFRGIDGDERCRGLLRIEVDWAEHQRQSAACGWIDIDGHWVQDVSPQIRGEVDRFKWKMCDKRFASGPPCRWTRLLAGGWADGAFRERFLIAGLGRGSDTSFLSSNWRNSVFNTPSSMSMNRRRLPVSDGQGKRACGSRPRFPVICVKTKNSKEVQKWA